MRYDAPADVRAMLRSDMGAREFLEMLSSKKRYVDGIDFLAYALPPREGVWWSGLCLQHACGDALTQLERTAAIAAVRWVIQPTEENGAAAKGPAGAVGMQSAAGPMALAAGGGMRPGPFGPAQTVAMAVKLAAMKSPPAGMKETQRLYLELGIGVAEGKFA
jgi:hypothetical protein